MLMDNLLKKTCGLTGSMLTTEMMPGAAAVYLCGHAFFAVQATVLSRRTRAPVTALPQGINIVTFFAFSQLIMAPTYNDKLRSGASTEEAARYSYDTGLCACMLLAVLELVGVLFAEVLRANIPRAAMLSAIAGVSLTYIAMGFAVQIFAAPGTAMVSMLLMLLFYGGQVKLPLKVPGGVLAVAVGWFLAVASGNLGYRWFSPAADSPTMNLSLPAFTFPMPRAAFLATFADPAFWRHLSVVVPMWLVTLVNNLANIEAAAAVGDHYSGRQCLLGCALIDIGCCFLGNPFPSCVYIGHAAFKAMGCRVGYLYLNMVPTVYFGCMRGAGLLQQLVPIESGVGFLLWIGLQITAAGFEGDHTPEGWRHGPAVALGLIPSMSAWSWQTVETTYVATRGLLCDAMSADLRASTPTCDMQLEELMQKPSTPVADIDSPLGTFQSTLSPLFLSGMFALAQGYLLTAIALSSMLVHIIDGKFDKAALWILLLAAASAIGIIHNAGLDPASANRLFPVMYTLAALALLLSHALQNRSEQLREWQLKWVFRLIALSERFPSLPAPLRRQLLALGARLGLLRVHDDAEDPSPERRRSSHSSTTGSSMLLPCDLHTTLLDADADDLNSPNRRDSGGDSNRASGRQDDSTEGKLEVQRWRQLFADVPDWISPGGTCSPGSEASCRSGAHEPLPQESPERAGRPGSGLRHGSGVRSGSGGLIFGSGESIDAVSDQESNCDSSRDSKTAPLLGDVQPV